MGTLGAEAREGDEGREAATGAGYSNSIGATRPEEPGVEGSGAEESRSGFPGGLAGAVEPMDKEEAATVGADALGGNVV